MYFNDQIVSDVNINVNYYTDSVSFNFIQGKQTSLEHNFFVIDSTEQEYHSELDGAVGI
jgi:hypothetical protein